MPVNCNIATTGHKLQETSKDSLIVNSWSYTFANWVYVVLSRVRTRSGLLLNKKLDLKKTFTVPDKLLRFEERMKEKETEYLTQFHGVNETSDSSDSTVHPLHADDDEYDDDDDDDEDDDDDDNDDDVDGDDDDDDDDVYHDDHVAHDGNGDDHVND